MPISIFKQFHTLQTLLFADDPTFAKTTTTTTKPYVNLSSQIQALRLN